MILPGLKPYDMIFYVISIVTLFYSMIFFCPVPIHLSIIVAAPVVVSAVMRSPLPGIVPGTRRTPEVKVRLYKVSLSLLWAIGVPGDARKSIPGDTGTTGAPLW